MEDATIEYRKGYKYQLAKDFHYTSNIFPFKDAEDDFISIDMNGNLLVKAGYAWDGVSGPIQDTNENLRASLVHDAYYQLMRRRKVSKDYRKKADLLFKKILKEDGVPPSAAIAYYKALRAFGGQKADPSKAKKTITAPVDQAN